MLQPVKGATVFNGFEALARYRVLGPDSIGTWGLTPRLYAYACFAG